MSATSPYYQDERVTLYHADCREVMSGMGDGSVAAVLTDPPYTDRTHANAKTNKGRGHGTKAIHFDAFTDEDLRASLAECGRVSNGWVVATLDYRHAVEFDVSPPDGLKCQRLGVWVKPNPTPQITGDRPAQGWEAIAYLHRAKGRSKWNGGGVHGNYIANVVQGEGHPTAKPLPMLQDMVRKSTNPGDTVFDPFAGSGTTLRAALDEGRKAIGVELEERYCELIANRLSQGAFDLTGL